MSTPSVIIQEFKVAYNIPRTLRDCAAIRDRLDHILHTQLERAWDRCVLGSETEEGYYFIDRLELSFPLNLAGWDDHAIARRWALRLYDALEKKIRSGTGVVYFEDRAHYLAAFLRALLKGEAAGEGCFRELLTFTAGETGSAAVQLLIAEPEVGRDALLLLSRTGSLPLLLASLSDEAIRQLWFNCIAQESTAPVFTGSYPVWVRRLLVFLKDFSLSGRSEPRDLLSLHLEFLKANPDLGPDTNLALFHRQLLRLCYETSGAPATPGKQGHADGNSGSEAFLSRLIAKVDETDVSVLLRLMVGSKASRARGTFCRCAGLFLLLPTIAEFRFNNFFASLETAVLPVVSPRSMILYLLGMQLLGSRRSEFARDAGLLLFSGLSEPPQWQAIQSCAESLSPAFHDCFLGWIAKSEERLHRHLRHRDAFRKRHAPDNLSFLAPDKSPPPSGTVLLLDRSIAAFGNATLREFTARLGSFAESSIDFVVRNFFALSGEIAEQPQSVSVTFAACPLQALLRLTGFTSSDASIPELADRRLQFVFPGN